jgi:peptidoglycan/xylan/chitin deacetylase (PgdA/CDA1 family)
MTLTIFGLHGVAAQPLAVPHFCFPDRATLEAQLSAVAERYAVVPLRAGLDMLEHDDGGVRAAITLDDGFQTWQDLALPLLEKFDLHATCFLSTYAVESGEPLWFCLVHRALTETQQDTLTWAGRTWPLATTADRASAGYAVETLLKDLPGNVVAGEAADISTLLGVDPHAPLAEGSPYRPLNAEAIQALARSGRVEFAAHGHRHAILSTLPPEQQRAEIDASVRAVRDLTGHAGDVFAYPNGDTDDYDEHTMAALRDLGVTAAVTTEHGVCTENTPRLELPRISLGESAWERHFS